MPSPMTEIYIADACRTPMGRLGGQLAAVRPDDLAAYVVGALMERNPGLRPSDLEDVVWGAANQAGEDNRNVGRMAGLLAGLGIELTGQTVNRLCGSGLQAVVTASQALASGWGNVMIAGGSESMSRAPFVVTKPERAYGVGAPRMVDTVLGWRLTNPRMRRMYAPITLGETAEEVAVKYGVSRTDQDAVRPDQSPSGYHRPGRRQVRRGDSPHRRAVGSQGSCHSPDHIRRRAPAGYLHGGSGPSPARVQERRNGHRRQLIPHERRRGGSDPRHDERPGRYGSDTDRPARSSAAAGVHPDLMGIGPVPSTLKALDRAGLGVADLDLVELNEAFAAQAVACRNELGLDPETVNVNGGAIALGHPLGCSGARILTTLVHELRRREGRYGLATMCIGVGQGISLIVERV